MLLAWPEKAKNQDRDLRVVSHRSRVPPQAKKLFIINIGDVNTLLPGSAHTGLCLTTWYMKAICADSALTLLEAENNQELSGEPWIWPGARCAACAQFLTG